VANEKGVILVIKRGISREVFHEERLKSGVTAGLGEQAKSTHDAAGVGIYDEDWLIGRVKQDGVGRFLTDSINGQKLLTKFAQVLGEKSVKVIAVARQMIGKGLEL